MFILPHNTASVKPMPWFIRRKQRGHRHFSPDNPQAPLFGVMARMEQSP